MAWSKGHRDAVLHAFCHFTLTPCNLVTLAPFSVSAHAKSHPEEPDSFQISIEKGWQRKNYFFVAP